MRNIYSKTILFAAGIYINSVVWGALYHGSDLQEASRSHFSSGSLEAIAIPVFGLKKVPNGYIRETATISDVLQNVCQGQKFLDQPVISLGTSFLISERQLLMAGHSVNGVDFCRTFKFVFDYNLDRIELTQLGNLFFREDQVYQCEEIFQNKKDDFAIVKLDRIVNERKPFEIQKKWNLIQNDSYSMLGYPLGLPLKVTSGGKIVKENSDKLNMTISAFSGNSGSPILSNDSGHLVGLLQAGQSDFQLNQKGCYEYKICHENLDNCQEKGIMGEQVLKIDSTIIDPWLDEKRSTVKSLVEIYNEEVKERYGKEISLKFLKSDAVQALGGIIPGGIPEITIYEGLLSKFEKFEIAAITCHEIGHILGEVNFRDFPDRRPTPNLPLENSIEGEADYFGGKCLYNYFQRSNYRIQSDSNEYCKNYSELFNRKSDCSLAIQTAKKMLTNLYNAEIDFSIAIDEKYDGVNPRYPSKECRFLSMIHGIAGKDRPTCWYNPNL